YRNFTHHYIKVKRSIGVAAGEGKSATEIIAVSGPRCWMGFDYSRGVDSSAVYGVRA
ncbi:DNA adenine methylase, partial [Escherichia coli]|nr:DNA adenine methylase [Escherichia coli]